MAMVMKHPEVWAQETDALRKVLLACGLTEVKKWGKPCYALDSKNIAIIQGFKSNIALLFFKGYGMDDPKHILVKTGPNTRVGRQIRFTNVKEIEKMKATLKSYIKNAIEVEKSGKKAPPKKSGSAAIPAELADSFKKDAAFKTAFNALTPGRQNGYLFHFNGAVQSQTRTSRIEKYRSKIMRGKGMMDR